MRWARLVLAVSLMVGWTSAAAAERAWVLWVKLLDTNKIAWRWSLINAYETKDTCATSQAKVMKKVADAARERGASDVKITEDGKSVIYTERKDDPLSTRFFKYFCLPDTIDPRKKKG